MRCFRGEGIGREERGRGRGWLGGERKSETGCVDILLKYLSLIRYLPTSHEAIIKQTRLYLPVLTSYGA